MAEACRSRRWCYLSRSRDSHTTHTTLLAAIVAIKPKKTISRPDIKRSRQAGAPFGSQPPTPAGRASAGDKALCAPPNPIATLFGNSARPEWTDEEIEAEVADYAGSRHARTFSGNFEIGFQSSHSTSENKPRLRGINETPAMPRVAFRLGEFLFGTLPALRRGIHRLLPDLANRIQTAARGIGLFKIGHLPKLDRRPRRRGSVYRSGKGSRMILRTQVRAARALLGWTRDELARSAVAANALDGQPIPADAETAASSDARSGGHRVLNGDAPGVRLHPKKPK